MARTLLLDLDGTLVDTLQDLLAALNRVTHGGYTLAEVRPWIGDGATVLVARALAARGQAASAEDLDTLTKSYVEYMSDASPPYLGAIDTLRTLTALGWRCAVCTNKPERAAHALLNATGLAPFIVAVGGGDSFPVRKPDPAHVRATLLAAGGDLAGAVMVGDHQNDILAAAGAGIPSIFAAWGYGDDPAGATAIAARFTDLPAVLDTLNPSGTPTHRQTTASGP